MYNVRLTIDDSLCKNRNITRVSYETFVPFLLFILIKVIRITYMELRTAVVLRSIDIHLAKNHAISIVMLELQTFYKYLCSFLVTSFTNRHMNYCKAKSWAPKPSCTSIHNLNIFSYMPAYSLLSYNRINLIS